LDSSNEDNELNNAQYDDMGAYSYENYENKSIIEIALVVCGSRKMAAETIPLINSAILLSNSILNFHLIVENDIKIEFENIVIKLHFFKSFIFLNKKKLI
jgi:uncharacterized linocin/CFP29 family protein